MNKFDKNKALFQAPLHNSMLSLAREMQIEVGMLRYNLMKVRYLSLVKKILKENLNEKINNANRKKHDIDKNSNTPF